MVTAAVATTTPLDAFRMLTDNEHETVLLLLFVLVRNHEASLVSGSQVPSELPPGVVPEASVAIT